MKKFKELQIREVPAVVLAAVRAESFADLESDLGRVEALSMLSFSVFAEYFEMVLIALRRAEPARAADPDEKTFLTQEARHAAACHVLNERVLGPGAYRRDAKLGRIPNLVERSFYGQDAPTEELWFMAASVEADFGVQSVLAMEYAADARWLKHPGTYYLFLYHMAEEAEHSHVSWSMYERAFGPIDAMGPRFLSLLDAYGRAAARLMVRLGEHLGSPITSADAMDSWGRVTDLAKARAASGDLARFTGARFDCVRQWDDHWEPIYRRACEGNG
jgi:hypothetical protein